MASNIPVTLTTKQIQDFKRIYKQQFNIEISDERALEEGVRLLQFVSLVLKQEHSFKD